MRSRSLIADSHYFITAYCTQNELLVALHGQRERLKCVPFLSLFPEISETGNVWDYKFYIEIPLGRSLGRLALSESISALDAVALPCFEGPKQLISIRVHACLLSISLAWSDATDEALVLTLGCVREVCVDPGFSIRINNKEIVMQNRLRDARPSRLLTSSEPRSLTKRMVY